MRQLFLLSMCVLFTAQINGQSKQFSKLMTLYSKGAYNKLIKKAEKIKRDNNRSCVPYYFISMGYFEKSIERNNESYFNKSILLLKKAKKLDVQKEYWDYLGEDLANIKEGLNVKITNLSTRSKVKARRLCKSYLFLFEDTLSCYSRLFEEKNNVTEANDKSTINLSYRAENKRDSIKKIGESLIGIPYKWAGESTEGFDCSGFVMYVYQKVGVKLPHNANKISYLGQEVSEADAKVGDIILFGTKMGDKHRAFHSGIIYENINGQLKVIHCVSKGVHVSTNFDSYWKSRVMLITNVLDDYVINE